MIERTLEDLRRDLADRRRLGDPPPIVLLGAGASAEAGLATMQALYRFLEVADFDEFVGYIQKRNENERYRLLAEFLQTQDPHEVTPGYRALAALCEHAYFDVVLTTNFDPLLDDALATARLRRKDYLLLINGILRADRLRLLLSSRSPRVKVVKLHGDLFHRFMAWTPAEMEDFLDELTPSLAPFLFNRDFLVVGHSLRDERIRRLVVQAGGAVWFVNPSAVPDELKDLRDLRAVVGPGMGFEHLFTALAEGLEASPAADAARKRALPAVRGATRGVVDAAATAPGDTGRTIDDLIAATVGIAATESAAPSMTGFLLAEPRVVVTDGYAGNIRGFDPEMVTLVTDSGRRLTTRASRLLDQHAFGPWVLEAPPELKARGLHVNDERLTPGAALQIAIAAGTRTGLATGHVVSGREEAIPIQGLGQVYNLVHLRAVVAPGSSGAPAVDDGLTLRGFVVAGSVDEARPHTFIYPARRWLAQLRSGT
jgi:hypothetical protein